MSKEKMAGIVFLPVVFVFLLGIQCFAQEPPLNPNGFPSGPHYNLNLIGKKGVFNQDGLGCVVDPLAYGNVVFVQEYGQGDIWLKSGKKATASTLQVTDPCVTAFDGDAAELQLPANNNGYWVYARALGKLTDYPSMTITPQLITVSSENETLLYLGLVTSNGFLRADGIEITRTKGKHPAVPISDLFAWQGYVCYTTDPATIGVTDSYTLIDMCGSDTSNPADGIPDVIYAPPSAGVCADGVIYQLYCHYYDTTWVFNIADFVDYLWGIDNSGAKLVQIRFYPR
jgi:hypothetical protein